MEHTILHQGGFTAVLESNGTVTTRENGALPTLDDIARRRALGTYFSDIDRPSPTWYDTSEEL